MDELTNPRASPSTDDEALDVGLSVVGLTLGGLAHFSKWWWWDLTANRLTCTGMGTTILVPFPECCPATPLCLLDVPAVAMLLALDPTPPPLNPAFTLFHLALRFWNQIFTWTSDNFRAWAICDLSVRLRYFFAWNSRSSSRSCSEVKAVRLRLALLLLDPLVDVFWPFSNDPPGLTLLDALLDIVSVASWPSPATLNPPPSSSLSAEARPFSEPGTNADYEWRMFLGRGFSEWWLVLGWSKNYEYL